VKKDMEKKIRPWAVGKNGGGLGRVAPRFDMKNQTESQSGKSGESGKGRGGSK